MIIAMMTKFMWRLTHENAKKIFYFIFLFKCLFNYECGQQLFQMLAKYFQFNLNNQKLCFENPQKIT
jgi:hypothetical protein